MTKNSAKQLAELKCRSFCESVGPVGKRAWGFLQPDDSEFAKMAGAAIILHARWGDVMPIRVDANHESFERSNCARHRHHQAESVS